MLYYLMHANIKVLTFTMDDCLELKEILDYQHLPLPLQINNFMYRDKSDHLEDWLSSRVNLNYDFTDTVESWFSVSLSDAYWVKPENLSTTWDEVNLHDNGFDGNEVSPDKTAIGALPKFWSILPDKKRVLYKQGISLYNQEPYNEVIYGMISKFLYGEQSRALLYDIYFDENNNPWSVCRCFTSKNIEFIPACDILDNIKANDYKGMSMYEIYIAYLSKYDINKETLIEYLDQMFTVDYITGNVDRHFNNFGIMRDVNSLRFIKPALIFDSGNSLRCNQDIVTSEEIDFEVESFEYTEAEQVALVQHPIKIYNYDILIDNIYNYLHSVSSFKNDRILSICNFIEDRIVMYNERG